VSVPIVQCWEWGKVFGHITLDFDAKGHLIRWRNAAPIVVDSSIPDDPAVASMIAAFRRPIAAMEGQTVGEASVALPKEALGSGDGLMGDVISDGMLAATSKNGAVVAYVNSGGVRGGLEPGKVTYGELISIEPFGNTLVTLDLTGAELQASLEEGVGTGGLLIPSNGSSYSVDRSQSAGSRVSEVVVAGAPLDPNKTYRVTFLNFTANGGDSHVVLKNAKGARTDTGLIDLDALIDYVKANSPLAPASPARIKIRG
jgi:5'-nucleotidase